jgi:gamma-glutamyltranspeptidase
MSAAVAADNQLCSEIGVSILRQNGSAVDAAIATTLCIGVVHPQSSGIGGGGFMLVYDKGSVRTINFRETAPAAASQDMYTGFNDCLSTDNGGQQDTSRCQSRLGGLAVAVPGELRGLEAAHKLYGVLPWYDVVSPVATLCREGFPVSGALASSIVSQFNVLKNNTLLAKTFAPNGVPLQEGEFMTMPLLAKSLDAVAVGGADVLYNGEIAAGIVSTVANNTFFPGILTAEDLTNYRAVVENGIQSNYHDFTVSVLGLWCCAMDSSCRLEPWILPLGTLDPSQVSQQHASDQELRLDLPTCLSPCFLSHPTLTYTPMLQPTWCARSHITSHRPHPHTLQAHEPATNQRWCTLRSTKHLRRI